MTSATSHDVDVKEVTLMNSVMFCDSSLGEVALMTSMTSWHDRIEEVALMTLDFNDGHFFQTMRW